MKRACSASLPSPRARRVECVANVMHADTHTTLALLPPASYALVLCSPPYNVQKSYEQRALTHATYAEQQARVVHELCRVVSDAGAVCWQVGWTMLGRDAPSPLEWLYDELFAREGLVLQRRFYWVVGHGLHSTRRFSGRHETVSVYARHALDEQRVLQRWRAEFSGDTLCMLEREWTTGLLVDVPNVKASHVERTTHPAQFPVELAARFVTALCERSEWVLDPYCGVGSALCAALLYERSAVGIELCVEYVELARQRVQQASAGTLAVRAVGTRLCEPRASDKQPPAAPPPQARSRAPRAQCASGSVECLRLLVVDDPTDTAAVLARVSAACVCVCNIVIVQHTHAHAAAAARACGVLTGAFECTLRNRIVCAADSAPTVAWWLTRGGDNYVFDLDAVRVPSKYPHKRHYKGEHRGELSGNPLGKNPGDVWLLDNGAVPAAETLLQRLSSALAGQ